MEIVCVCDQISFKRLGETAKDLRGECRIAKTETEWS